MRPTTWGIIFAKGNIDEWEGLKRSPIRHTIYVLEHKESGKAYVGRTSYPMDCRWKGHLSPNQKHLIGRAVKAEGIDNFSLRILSFAYSPKEAALTERLFVHLFESNDPCFGYNSPRIYRISASDD